MWMSLYYVENEKDTVFFSRIFDFSEDSVFIYSFYYSDPPCVSFKYTVSNDSIIIPLNSEDYIYHFNLNGDYLTLFPSDSEENMRQDIYFRLPPESPFLDSLHGPYAWRNEHYKDTLEFINDTTSIIIGYWGNKELSDWKKHKINGIQILEFWTDDCMSGYPQLLFPTALRNDGFLAISNYNPTIVNTFSIISDINNYPAIRGTWKQDSVICHFFDPIDTTYVIKKDIRYDITQDSIKSSDGYNFKYISDYTGKEPCLIYTHKEEDCEFDMHFWCKILEATENKLILRIQQSRKFLCEQYIYLSK